MRAAVHHGYGPPDIVRVIDVPLPTVRDRDLLVRVHSTTVNRTDCAYRAGRPLLVRPVYGLPGPRAKVLGCEFAGDVEAVGPAVTTFRVGDRVFGYNEGPFGAHAEFLALPATASVATIPANVTYPAAAAATEGSHYALSTIVAARVRPGQRVLVHGATGAIGSAAVQLLSVFGARVTAVCATEYVDLVGSLGAHRVIDYTAVDFTRDDETFDVVIDAVGKSSFGACRRLLSPRGAYLSTELGRGAQNPLLALITPALRGRRVLFPIPHHSQTLVQRLRSLLEAGRFRPLVDRHYPLDRIVDAHRYAESGRKIGSVVIDVSSSGSPAAGIPAAN